MRSGHMDRRIQLQHRSLSVRDVQGQQIESWTTYATIWASRADVKAREFIVSQQANAELTTKYVIRYRSDVLYTDRLVEGAVSYNIRSLAEIGRHEGLEILATALVS